MRTEQYVFYRRRNRKFMQMLEGDQIRRLTRLARRRGIGLQEYLRAVVIPEWLWNQKADKRPKRKRRRTVHADRQGARLPFDSPHDNGLAQQSPKEAQSR
ncbi:hypothetical protein E6H23_04365 [Candidatus Bathyarchaeota archaeon]|nr:MAG: hypothetical protein E6H23_04365 [Candidatus Bathyarchaeota archaeon]